MIETVRRTSGTVKRWQSGDMCLRWTAAGMLEAERQFRKIIGYRDIAKLALAIERDLHHHQTQEVLLTLAGSLSKVATRAYMTSSSLIAGREEHRRGSVRWDSSSGY